MRSAYREVPRRAMSGRRNILVHGYGQIDHKLRYKTAVADIPAPILRCRTSCRQSKVTDFNRW